MIYRPQEAKMVGGAYHGKLLKDVPTSYLQWLVYESGLCEIEDVQFNKMAFVAQWIRDNLNIPEPKESNWVGEVGDKIQIAIEIDSVRTLEGLYGYTYLYRLIDVDGNVFTWFASKDALRGLTGRIALKATVKRLDEYKGVKQTVITRAKVI